LPHPRRPTHQQTDQTNDVTWRRQVTDLHICTDSYIITRRETQKLNNKAILILTSTNVLILVACVALFVASRGLGTHPSAAMPTSTVNDDLIQEIQQDFAIQLAEKDIELNRLHALLEDEMLKNASMNNARAQASNVDDEANAELQAALLQIALKDAEINEKEEEIARQTAELDDLSSRLSSSQDQESLLSAQLAALNSENARLARIVDDMELTQGTLDRNVKDAQTLAELKDAYAQYIKTTESGDVLALQQFLEIATVRTVLPGLHERIIVINQHYAEDGYREGVVNLSNVVQTALRIRNSETRTRYLTGVRDRFQNDPAIRAKIDFLIERM
jgi:hypothetical protein